MAASTARAARESSRSWPRSTSTGVAPTAPISSTRRIDSRSERRSIGSSPVSGNCGARRRDGGPIFKNDDGEWVTQTVDDACIFLNRPGFEHGAGCALHQAAVRRGERPLDWKPDVCWQVPIRFDEHTDDNGHSTFILREWKRRDWGRAADFGWWCTDDPAFNEDRRVEDLWDEIIEPVGRPYQRPG